MKSTPCKSSSVERFIPVNINELIQTLSHKDELETPNKPAFESFCRHYQALHHAQVFPTYQQMVNHYIPFNPDIETIDQTHYSPDEKKISEATLLNSISLLLNKANYEKLSRVQLSAALSETSPYGVEVSVNFDEFSENLLFYRGTHLRRQEQRDWKTLFFKKKTVSVKVYNRLFILLKFKSLTQQSQERAENRHISFIKSHHQLKSKHKKYALDEDKIYIKLFKNIPCSDLEMLFPNTKIKMRLFDKLKLGVTGGSGTVGGIMTIASKLTLALDPLAIAMATIGFIGLLWRQVNKVFSQRTKYMAELAKNLYYYNLDNNLGVIAHLNEIATESETKEMVLSYFFLYTHGEMTLTELDKKIEQFIWDEYHVAIDFEVSDGLDKLRKLGMLIEKDTQLNVVSLATTRVILQQQWQACF